MPLYFFHRTDGVRIADTDGTELPSLDAARLEAVVTLGQTIKDEPDFVWDHRRLGVEVTDASGAVVATITLIAS